MAHCDRNDGSWQNGIVAHSHRTGGSFERRLFNGGMILGEIGDIHRFSNPSKLLAFAGLDPSVYQSGNFQAKTTRMSKRGSRVLRYALMNAAWNVVRNNATFRAYYDAKRAEGRSHYNALGHCAGKLVRVIWKMLTDEVEFNLE